MPNYSSVVTNSEVESPPIPVRVVVLTRSEKFENEMVNLFDLPGLDLKVSCLRSEIEILPNSEPRRSTTVRIGSVTIEKPVIHGMLEQHQTQAVRFMEPASLIVIAFESDPLTQELAEQLEKLSSLLGINTLLFPMSGNTTIALTPLRGSFSSLLTPANGDGSKGWSQVLNALVRCFITQGLICVDWVDIENVFDHSRCCSYHQINTATAAEAFEALTAWIPSTFTNRKLSHLIVIFRFDSTLRFSVINKTMNYLREFLFDDTSVTVAAPMGDIPALTLIWS
jgi:hypothetical protein